jgi:Zn-finger nucleic acid-binding protein
MPACSHCSKPMSASSAVCPHCARPPKPDVRPHHQTISCPKCQSRCDVVLFGQVHLDMCRGCRGLWFDKDELRQFGDALADTDLSAQVAEVLRELGPRSSSAPPATYSACPVCLTRMTRTNYARVSGIIVDTCAQHGTWADHDEALRLIELFADGREEHLREIVARQEKDDLARTLHRLKLAQATNVAHIHIVDTRSRVHLLLDWLDLL